MAAPQVDAWRLWCKAQGLRVVGSELFVCSDRLAVAGTVDKIIELPSGEAVLADLKTGYAHHTHILQVAIYGLLMRERTGWRPEYGAVIYIPFRTSLVEAVVFELSDHLLRIAEDVVWAGIALIGLPTGQAVGRSALLQALEELRSEASPFE